MKKFNITKITIKKSKFKQQTGGKFASFIIYKDFYFSVIVKTYK